MASKLDQHLEQVRSLAASGSTKRYVAQCFNVDEASVRRFAKAHGIAFNNTAGLETTRPDTLSSDIDQERVELPVITRDYSHLESLRVYPLGDVHVGAPMHQADRWQEWIDYIVSQPDATMISTGDLLNAGLKDSKTEVYDETMTVGRAKRLLRDQLAPLADAGRLDLMIPGNHEDRIYRAIGDCPIEDLSDHLSVPYARAVALVRYIVGDVEYQFFVRHGTGNGQTLLALDKGFQIVPLADVHLSAHTHKQAITASEYFVLEGDRMVRRRSYKLSGGSFLAWERYCAERAYAPTRIGAPRIFLSGRSRDVHASL